MYVQQVIFHAPKQGYAEEEWEDGARAGSRPGRAGGRSQPGWGFAVADGATEAYAARRWVLQLLDSFMAAGTADGTDGPELDRGSMRRWMDAMQQQWQQTAAAVANPFEQAKIRKGSLATFVGGQFLGLGTSQPAWQAVALGDAVLFHIRRGRLIAKLPRLRAADFDTTPAGISTLPGQLDQMSSELQEGNGRLEAGDVIFVATDAIAQWMLSCDERGDGERWLWPTLSDPLLHPGAFARLIDEQRRTLTDEQRRTRALKDDDVTLLRLRLLSMSEPPSALVMYQ